MEFDFIEIDPVKYNEYLQLEKNMPTVKQRQMACEYFSILSCAQSRSAFANNKVERIIHPVDFALDYFRREQ